MELSIINTTIEELFKKELAERYATTRILLDDLTGLPDKVKSDFSAEQLYDYYKKNVKNEGFGYHFVIRKDGSIERGIPIWARGNLLYKKNWNSLIILVNGRFDDEELTKEQIESIAMLLADLTDKYSIPIEPTNILPVKSAADTVPPGKNLINMMETLIGKAIWYRYEGQKPVITTPKVYDDSMLSEHFSKSEFWCHGVEQGTCRCNHSINVNPRLIELVEELRSNIGGLPLYINSGYRCPDHNFAVGGVSNSQHLLGNAADISVPYELSFEQFQWYVEQLPFDGIGLYHAGNFIHCDVRYGGVGEHIIFYGA